MLPSNLISGVFWVDRPQRQVRVSVTSAPESFGETFMGTGAPTLYLLPVAAICFQLERDGEISFTPWIGVQQSESLIAEPRVNTGTVVSAVVRFEAGVVGSFIEEPEW